MKGYDEKWLRDQGLVKQADGTYKKEKQRSSLPKRNPAEEVQKNIFRPNESDCIEIKLFGIPLPKQSARMGKYGVYQPKKYKDRIADYRQQMLSQLPEDFKMFEKEVTIEEMTVIFPALKKFNKSQCSRS